jgi:hypothetical protein
MCERCARREGTLKRILQWVCIGIALLTGVLMVLTQFVDLTRFVDPDRLWGYALIFSAAALNCWLSRRRMR